MGGRLTGAAGDRLYFVVETKGSQFLEDLRPGEAARIRCGQEHFEEIAQRAHEPDFLQVVTAEQILTEAATRSL